MKDEGIEQLIYQLDEEAGGLKVGDYLTNTESHLALKRGCADAIVAGFDVGSFELVPAQVLNEKKRVHASDIVVLHPVHTVDCIDWKQSQLNRDKEDPRVRIFGAWSLEADRVPAELDLFRVKGLFGFIFSERLVDFIQKQGFENFVFEDVKLT